MLYTLLKSQYHVDESIIVPSGQYKGITFPQRSTLAPDDFGFEHQLPSYKFTITKSGILQLTAAFRYIQQPDIGDLTVLAAAYVQHPSYNNRKLVLKSRIVTNGPCDTTIPSMPFYINAGTEIWLDLWQLNAYNINLQVEYCYLGVQLNERD